MNMKNLFLKLNICIFVFILFSLTFYKNAYAIWGATEKGGIFWINQDFTFPRGEWKLIDDDNDGVGYYYYFNDNGFILIDDITPDYYIVDKFGRRIDFDGKEVAVKIEHIDISNVDDEEIYSDEILAEIKKDAYVSNIEPGFKSTGQINATKKDDEGTGPKPSDNLVIDTNPDGTAKWLLGPNVVLKKDKNAGYDGTMDKKMQSYIVSGSNYSKKVNGTIFTKGKWKDVMSLKGTGATIVFENKNNNFNKLKGRIATHYFSYTERTTQCTLFVYNDDNGEELTSTSNFNYNGGATFECTFPRKANKIRFELEVSGQYTSRVCYLRDCEFGYDKAAYEEELYEDEIEAEYNRRYNFGTASEADYVDEEVDDSMGEVSVEGEDPGVRYRRINGITTDDDLLSYDIDDPDLSDAIKASISELKKRMEAEDNERDKVAGPAFDEALKNLKPTADPLGNINVIEGKEGS